MNYNWGLDRKVKTYKSDTPQVWLSEQGLEEHQYNKTAMFLNLE